MRPKFLPTKVALPTMRDLFMVTACWIVVPVLVNYAELEYERDLEPPASKNIIRFDMKEGQAVSDYPNLTDAPGDVSEKSLLLFNGDRSKAEEWLGKPNALLGGRTPLDVAFDRLGKPNSGEEFLCRMMDAYRIEEQSRNAKVAG